MPRIARKPEADPSELKRQIDIGMASMQMDKRILLQKLGMQVRTFNWKVKSGYWTYEELFNIATVLRFSDESILKLFGR